jgi:hypothetical protein
MLREKSIGAENSKRKKEIVGAEDKTCTIEFSENKGGNHAQPCNVSRSRASDFFFLL